MASKKTGKEEGVKVVPLGDRVLVKLLTEIEKKTASGIIIPESASNKKSGQGEVVAVGEGRITEDGKKLPMHVKVGDAIVFSEYAGEAVKVEGEEFYILGEQNILAIIK